MINLIGLTREEIMQALKTSDAIDIPQRQLKMRANQLWHWIYVQGARDFDCMTTIAKELRQILGDVFTLERPEIVAQQTSNDGTRKWLVRLVPSGPGQKGAEVEIVYIPEETRGTLCVSSQVGCTLTCSFCHTGTQRLVRNLTAGEITAQLLIAKDTLDEWPKIISPTKSTLSPGPRQITNVVLMGMGEPLYNFDNVKQAVHTMSDDAGLSISKRRITLSTSGVVPLIERCGKEIGSMLAISLHAVNDDIRNQLVPINKKYPLYELLEACRNYPGLANSRRITFEYVMLKGVNDSLSDARELVKLLKGIPAKINLIPFNPWPGSPFECSDWEVIENFAEVVYKAGYASPVRTPRGRDIMAACGQLKSASLKLSVKQRKALEEINTSTS
jgi:23S rRNA (adenine2503-C2)-methyltransferase